VCEAPCSRGCFRPSEFGIVSWIASFIIEKYKKSKENYILFFRLSSMGGEQVFRAPAFTFFSIKIPLKVVCSEEKKLPQGRRSRNKEEK
jgi:hypothetical protein